MFTWHIVSERHLKIHVNLMVTAYPKGLILSLFSACSNSLIGLCSQPLGMVGKKQSQDSNSQLSDAKSTSLSHLVVLPLMGERQASSGKMGERGPR